jgi:hypothetical protein
VSVTPWERRYLVPHRFVSTSAGVLEADDVIETRAHTYCTNCWCETQGDPIEGHWEIPAPAIVERSYAWDPDVCCRCGNWTTSGIRVPQDASEERCPIHNVDEDSYDDTYDPDDDHEMQMSLLATALGARTSREVGWSTHIHTIDSPLFGGTHADDQRRHEAPPPPYDGAS